MADLENDKSSSKQQCEKLQEQLEQVGEETNALGHANASTCLHRENLVVTL